ncbi:PAAR domain-containing protein [Kribbella sp. NPDC050820]|uniref:PAAR domain-containing protein n=1 Tax=Kribbella sp. NPDC050820 TaxID=3155408 RepID=UPI0033D07A04
MPASAARAGDRVTALDSHLIQPPGTTPPVVVPHPFSGIIDGSVSSNVIIGGAGAATVGSTASNTPPHLPQGGTFVIPPTNRGQIVQGSATVLVNGKGLARAGDQAQTCDDLGLITGVVVAVGIVLAGS